MYQGYKHGQNLMSVLEVFTPAAIESDAA